jgi:UDP-GlcNAc:undecaprenyl-phosphate GlcNAc-1-phosphate transferase
LTYFYLIIASTIIFFSVYIKKDSLAKKLRLIDLPDKKLKNHSNKTPVIGGIILNAIIILILVTLIYANNTKNMLFIKILLLSVSCSIVGIIDDMYKIKANLKFFFLTLILFFFIIFFPELKIKHVIFSENFFIKNLNFDKKVLLSIILTILSYQLLIHAFNMADGHDGIASLMAITWLIYLLCTKTNLQFLLPIITSLLLFIYFNLKSKIFLGDSGNYLLSTLIASLIIFNNNVNVNFLAEEIFILLMLPGIDMLRLFIVRIKNDQNPLIGDRRHLHHLLFNKFAKNTTTLIYFSLFITPIFLFYFKIFTPNQIIIFFLVIYTLVIFKYNK